MPFGICHHKTICRRDKTCFFCNLRIDYTVCLTDSRDFIRKLRRRISYQQDAPAVPVGCPVLLSPASSFVNSISAVTTGSASFVKKMALTVFISDSGSVPFSKSGLFKARVTGVDGVITFNARLRLSDPSRYRCFHSSQCRHYCTQTISLPPMQTYQNTSFSFFYN